jgi:D-threo-aldose 1-dehydrogenase
LQGILQKCLDNGVGVVVGGAYNSGILATGAIEGAKFNYEDASPEIMERTKKLEAVCKEFGITLASAALQFPLGHKAVATVIPGCKSVFEVERSVETIEAEIPQAFWAKLKADGLLPDGVPTP